jgi:flagellar basal-body rod protein FlgB
VLAARQLLSGSIAMLSNAMFSSTSIPVLEQVVNFAQARHSVLAGNLANIDTPGYKTRDLPPAEFEARLRKAIDERDRMQSSCETRSPSCVPFDPVAQVSDDLKGILYHDESNVSVEHQVAEITKNQTQHNLALSILNSQFRQLQAAISERA